MCVSRRNATKNPCEDLRHVQPRSQEKSAWSDEGAPYPSADFTVPQLLWFLCIASVSKMSVYALNEEYLAASILWIIYECYIVFDHGPFLFANSVYKSPSFNYRYINLIFFWGMEAVACIVATQSLVGAPCILLYNAPPHLFFVAAHINQTATSKAFFPSQMKTWWVYAHVTLDNIIHLTSLWYHLKYVAVGQDWYSSPLSLWTGLVSSMVLLTHWVHGDEMSWSNFFAVSGNNTSE